MTLVWNWFDKKDEQNFKISVFDAEFTRQVPFIGFTYSPDDPVSTTLVSSAPSSTIITSPVPTLRTTAAPVESAPRVVSSSSQAEMKSDHEEMLQALQRQQSSLVEELTRLRQLHDQSKNESMQQKRQLQLDRDFFTEQSERVKREQADHLLRTLALFQDLPDPKKAAHPRKPNHSARRLEEIQQEFDQQVHAFVATYQSLLASHLENKEKTFVNDLSLLLSKFQEEFAQLLRHNGNADITLSVEYENKKYPVFKDLLTLLNNLYKHMNKVLNERSDLTEKLVHLEKKYRMCSKWIAKIHQLILQDASTSTHVTDSANRMVEELDRLEEATNRRGTIISTSSMTNMPHVLSHSLKLQHMEIQQLQAAMEREIQVREQVESKLKQAEMEISRLKEENQAITKQQASSNREATHAVQYSPADIDEHRTADRSQSYEPPERSSIVQSSPDAISNERPLMPRSNPLHDFSMSSFRLATTCHHCRYVLVGMIRQGFICKRCATTCHGDCLEHIVSPCDISNKDRNRINLLEQHIVRIPKGDDLRKDWKKCQLLITESKIVFYDLAIDTNITWPQPFLIVDITDDNFHVSSLTSQDRIDMEKTDLSKLFKIRVTQLPSPERSKYLYVSVSSAAERDQYIDRLSNLQALHRTHSTEYETVQCREIRDITLRKIKAALLLDRNRFLLSSDDGLHLFDISADSSTKLYDKKVYQLSLVSNSQLLIILCGKERMIRIKSLQRLLDRFRSPFDTKIPETKNATLFAIEPVSLILCVAIKNGVHVYKIHSKPQPYPYTHLWDLHTQQIVTYLDISMLTIDGDNERLIWYGYSSTFRAQTIDRQVPSVDLLSDKDPTLKSLRERSLEIVRVIPLENPSSSNELLLVFRQIGVYVNFLTGMRTRYQELMWSALPIFTSYSQPYLSIYTEKSVDIYDVFVGTWLQSLPLTRACPLTVDGTISLARDQSQTKLIQLASHNPSKLALSIPERTLPRPLSTRSKIARSSTMHSPRSPSDVFISEPMDYRHVEHIGANAGRQILVQISDEGRNSATESHASHTSAPAPLRYRSPPRTNSVMDANKRKFVGVHDTHDEIQRRVDANDLPRRSFHSLSVDEPEIIDSIFM